MGREVRIAEKKFKGPLSVTWWGYLLAAITCQSCDGSGGTWPDAVCAVCEGEGTVHPKVEPPAYAIDSKVGAMYRDGLLQGNAYDTEHYGWQMWETVSEGSPISPVCDTPEDLARWLADNNASSFGPMTATYEQWLTMIGQGSTVSAMYSPQTGLVSGVEYVGREASDA